MMKLMAHRQRFLPKSLLQVTKPKSFGIEEWLFPQNALFHHFSDEPLSETSPLVSHEQQVTIFPVTEVVQKRIKGISKAALLKPKLENYLKSLERPLMRGRYMERDLVSLSALPVKDYHFIDQLVQYKEEAGDREATDKVRYAILQNKLDTLLNNLGREETASSEVLFIKAPDTLPSIGEIRRVVDTIPVSKLEAWTNPSMSLMLELHRALVNPEHRLRQLRKPLLLGLEKAGRLFALDVTQLIEWADKDQQATSLALHKFFLSAASVGAADLPDEDEEPLDAEVSEDDVFEQVTIQTTDEHGDTITAFVSSVEVESEGIDRAVKAEQVKRTMTKQELKRIEKLTERQNALMSPTGDEPLVKANKKALTKVKRRMYEPTLTDKPAVKDKSMLNAATKTFTEHYVENGILEADMANMVLAANKMGYFVTDYQVEEQVDALNQFKEYRFKLETVTGGRATSVIRIPTVTPEGTYRANGVKYRTAIQKVDLPIRKTAPDKVALTSDYGKLTARRSHYQAFNLSAWFVKRLMAERSSSEPVVEDIRFTNQKPPKEALPRAFTAIGSICSGFTVHGVKFNFSAKKMREINKDAFENGLKKGYALCGSGKGALFSLDNNGDLWKADKSGFVNLGNFANWINPDWGTPPTEFANINIRGRAIPIIIFTSYIFATLNDTSEFVKSGKVKAGSQGLQAALEYHKVPHRWASKGSKAEPNELVIRFDAESLYVRKDNPAALLVVAGLSRIAPVVRRMSPSDFNAAGTYSELMESFNARRSLTAEMTLVEEAFVDPITEELLIDMGEPTTFLGLLDRCAELLTTDQHEHETNRKVMRDRGYERFAGIVYKELLNAVREHRRSPYPEKGAPSIAPKAVWKAIGSDQASMLVEESNPYHNMKEQESLTYTGIGGRSPKTMTEATRRFYKEDIGAMSEAVPDSSKVGVRAYAPPGIKYNSVRGTLDAYDPEKDGSTGGVSSTALLKLNAEQMDPKRVMLMDVQGSSTVACTGGRLLPVRTGFEMTVLERISDDFGIAAKEKGKVVEVTDGAITVNYDKIGPISYPLGKQHGLAAGACIPHVLVTDLKAGHKFVKGDAITWNQDYFMRDVLNPGGVSMRSGYLARTAYKDDARTLEDSSEISKRCSRMLATPISKQITIGVKFTDEVRDLVTLGQTVESDTALLTIEDSVVAGMGQSDSTLQGLSKLGAKFPKAKQAGEVSRIEVIYNGEISEMTESLQKLVKADNKRRREESKLEGRSKAPTGQIADTTYYNKVEVVPGTVAITFYVDAMLDAEVGDKGVVNNPLKSIFGGVMDDSNRTESGKPIDILFAYQSVDNRILYSAITNLLVYTYLDKSSDDIVAAYDS